MESKNHNVILVARPGLLTSLALRTNEDLQSRVTYSVCVAKLVLAWGDLDRADALRAEGRIQRRSANTQAHTRSRDGAGPGIRL